MLEVILLAAAVSADRPSAGELPASLAGLDDVVNDAMDAVGATAASFAVSLRGDEAIHAKAWGWANRGGTVACTPERSFRIGSNAKPFTNAAVHRLFETTDLTPDTRVLPLVDIRPRRGRLGDERLSDVTVGQLLDHRAGFAEAGEDDPTFKLAEIRKRVRVKGRFSGRHVVEYVFAEPLAHDPGSRRAYSNFGYILLGRVIEAQTGEPYERALRRLVCDPLGIDDVRVTVRTEGRRPPLEVDYPSDSDEPMHPRDAAAGLVASPTSLCRLMAARWITGPPRPPGRRGSFYHHGSMPHTTLCWMVQRSDGTDWAMAFNSRRNELYHEDLAAIQDAVTTVLEAAAVSWLAAPRAASEPSRRLQPTDTPLHVAPNTSRRSPAAPPAAKPAINISRTPDHADHG